MSAATVEELIAAVLPRLKRVQGAGDNVSARCPFDDHEDRSSSFSLNKKTGLWKCHGRCARKGNAYTLARDLGFLPAPRRRSGAAVTVDWGLDVAMEKYGVEVTNKAAVFKIIDDEGNVCRRHARLHNPRPDEPRFQFWDKDTGRKTHHAYVPDWALMREWGAGCGIAFVVEGERDALTLAVHGWPAVGILGVGQFDLARKDIAEPLGDMGIGALVLTPDNDLAGLEAVSQWTPALTADGFVVGVRTLPQTINAQPVKDTFDAFAVDPDGFDDLMHSLPVYWRA